MKTCNKCNQTKPLEDFHKHQKTKDKRQPRCKVCAIKLANEDYAKHPGKRKAQVRAWAAKNIEKRHAYQLKHRLLKKFGVSVDIYEGMLLRQGGKCAICLRDDPKPKHWFSVDHCHVSGKIRGLLCMKCNTSIGFLKDDPEMARRAMNYLLRDF